jgi:hypothetical protein
MPEAYAVAVLCHAGYQRLRGAAGARADGAPVRERIDVVAKPH